MQRCGVPECGTIVNQRRNTFVRIGDKIFCDNDCANTWLVQNKVFEVAAHPFHVPTKPRKLNGGG